MRIPAFSNFRRYALAASLTLGAAISGCNSPASSPNSSPAAAAPVANRPLHERAQESEKNEAGEIVGMSLMFNAVSDADLEQLDDYPHLASLRLQECPQVRGAGFTAVVRLPELTTLSILNAPIEDEFVSDLASAPLLKDLTLQRTRITGSTLADLPLGLERLELGGRGIDPASLQAVNRLTNLKVLGLHLLDRPLSELPALNGLTQLETLDLTGTAVDDEGLKRLVELETLRILRFEPKSVTDDGATTLARLSQLEELDLATSQVTDEGFARMQSLTELKVLWLPRGVSDAGLSHLKAMQNLQILELRHTRINGTGLANLTNLKNLREVILPNRQLSDDGKRSLQALRRSLPDCYIAVAGGG